MGKADITVERKGLLYELCLIRTPRNVQSILGKDSCNKLNLIKRLNIIQNMDKNNILSANEKLFKGIGCLLERVHIKRAQDALPFIEACRKIPFAMYNEVKIEFDSMEKGIIKKVT